jgi:hypothetical protein
MAFHLEKVVPWGRTLEEYRKMFTLTDVELGLSILGCGDGPASFNKEMTALGHKVLSIDPLYQFSTEQIRGRIDISFNQVLQQVRENQDEFVWESIASPDELGRLRMGAMQNFLADFERGNAEGRYCVEELPTLPFAEKQFDLALCSHFLFLYSDQLSLKFHRESIAEMCRVAKEVRIFPLLKLGSIRSQHVEKIANEFTARGYTVSIETVNYEFQRGGNEMMKINTM